MNKAVVGAAGAVVLVAAGVVTFLVVPRGNGAQEPAPEDERVAAYVQTWEQSYATTDCSEWKNVMTEQQRFAASADILASAWQKIEGSSDFPSDPLIRRFGYAITDACIDRSFTLTDVSYGVYVSDAATFGP